MFLYNMTNHYIGRNFDYRTSKQSSSNESNLRIMPAHCAPTLLGIGLSPSAEELKTEGSCRLESVPQACARLGRFQPPRRVELHQPPFAQLSDREFRGVLI